MNALKTTMSNGLQVLIDWLSFTVFTIENPKDAIEYFGLNFSDFKFIDSGYHGYKCQYVHSMYSIKVFCNPSPSEMGIHFKISGSALPHFCDAFFDKVIERGPFGPVCVHFDDNAKNISRTFSELFAAILSVGKVTRIDLAVDDLGNKFFSCDDVHEFYENHQIITTAKKFKHVRSEESHNKDGETLYFGSRSSDRFLRVYDKALEQKSKHRPDAPSSWTRWELEIKGKTANLIAERLSHADSLADIVVGQLGDFLRIIERDKSNISRCSVVELWQKFLNGISKLHITIMRIEKTLADTKTWIVNSVAPSLAAIFYADGGDLDSIIDYVKSGALRINKSQKRQLMQMGIVL